MIPSLKKSAFLPRVGSSPNVCVPITIPVHAQCVHHRRRWQGSPPFIPRFSKAWKFVFKSLQGQTEQRATNDPCRRKRTDSISCNSLRDSATIMITTETAMMMMMRAIFTCTRGCLILLCNAERRNVKAQFLDTQGRGEQMGLARVRNEEFVGCLRPVATRPSDECGDQ